MADENSEPVAEQKAPVPMGPQAAPNPGALRAPEKGESKFEKVEAKNASLLGEVFGFLAQNKKWWLLPIVGTFLVIGVLVLLSTTAAAPFIYTFF